jgi:hypothetical protein
MHHFSSPPFVRSYILCFFFSFYAKHYNCIYSHTAALMVAIFNNVFFLYSLVVVFFFLACFSVYIIHTFNFVTERLQYAYTIYTLSSLEEKKRRNKTHTFSTLKFYFINDNGETWVDFDIESNVTKSQVWYLKSDKERSHTTYPQTGQICYDLTIVVSK